MKNSKAQKPKSRTTKKERAPLLKRAVEGAKTHADRPNDLTDAEREYIRAVMDQEVDTTDEAVLDMEADGKRAAKSEEPILKLLRRAKETGKLEVFLEALDRIDELPLHGIRLITQANPLIIGFLRGLGNRTKADVERVCHALDETVDEDWYMVENGKGSDAKDILEVMNALCATHPGPKLKKYAKKLRDNVP